MTNYICTVFGLDSLAWNATLTILFHFQKYVVLGGRDLSIEDVFFYWRFSRGDMLNVNPKLIHLFKIYSLIFCEYLVWWGKKDTIFRAALLIIVKTWQQSSCLSADEWIPKLGYLRHGILEEINCQAKKRHVGTLNAY